MLDRGGDAGRERVKTAILVLLTRGAMTAEELEGATIAVTGTSLRTFQRARAELAEEGTIERFQAPGSDPGSNQPHAPRRHWWRLALPDHAPSA